MSAGSLDRGSFEAVFRQFFPALMTFARKYLQDEDSAREVVHIVMINLWEKRATLDASESLKPYLFKAVHNRCLNVMRDRRKFSEELVTEPLSDRDVQEQMELMELNAKINQVIDSLPERCKEVFEMNRFEGKRYKEIAEDLGISVKTVENQMSKALKILRDQLASYLTVLFWVFLLLFT
jgi:RNA polymerase sigma-70 factor, ECF subfamily